jgi:hypothetical protein
MWLFSFKTTKILKMDALLRYILYKIAYTLLGLELFLMVFFALAIIVTKLITKWRSNRRKENQEQISNLFEEALLSDEPVANISIPNHLLDYRNIIETLERFDQRFKDERWKAIKEKVVGTYLIPKTESYGTSYSWFNRLLAARTFFLCPNLANEHLLKKLLDDPRYLIRVTAAASITKISNEALFYDVIKMMSKETHLSQFRYRDALLEADEEKYRWIEHILSKETDPEIINICLDIVSSRYSNRLLTTVKPFLKNSHRACRIIATRALGNIPNEESIELLQSGAKDSDWEIRSEAIVGLQKTFATQAIPELKELLNDPVWWVRLKAAMALKSFGDEGIKVLHEQRKEKHPLAHEISQYILAMP